jgi:hypothetical protein
MRYERKERGVEIEAQLRLYFFYNKTWKVNMEPCSNCASRIRLITTYCKPLRCSYSLQLFFGLPDLLSPMILIPSLG